MKHTTLILIFILTITTSCYSKGECTFSVSIDCPKADSEYWGNYIFIRKNNELVKLLKQNEKITLPYGKYTFSILTEFLDSHDTTITLDKEEMHIALKINWRYIFQNYSNSTFETEGDTIKIYYERKFCSGGVCAHDYEMMSLFRTKNGNYLCRHFDAIKTEFCLEAGETNSKEDLLSAEKTKTIQNYFLSNYIPIDKRDRGECYVKIGHHIYYMKTNTYLKFREELLKEQ